MHEGTGQALFPRLNVKNLLAVESISHMFAYIYRYYTESRRGSPRLINPPKSNLPPKVTKFDKIREAKKVKRPTN